MHLFLRCRVVELFWRLSPWPFLSSKHVVSTVSEWWWSMANEMNIDKLEWLGMALWALWSERNKVLWKNACFDPSFLSNWVCSYLGDFQKARARPSSSRDRRPRVRWSCPPRGRLKVNIDGSFCSDKGIGGVGVIVHDENGVGVAALARQHRYAISALHMEVEACRAGLQLGISQGWSDVDIESDSILLITTLARSGEDLSDFGRIIEDCKALFSGFHSIRVRHILREANGVADRLAHLASSGGFSGEWLGETPAIIQDVLYEDYMFVSDIARGLGSQSPSMQNDVFQINIINGV